MPPTAAASTLSATTPAGESGMFLTFAGAAGETNQFRFDEAQDDLLRVRDPDATLTSAAPGCNEDRIDGGFLCDLSAYAGIAIDFGDGDDEIYNTTPYPGKIIAGGGPGNDRLIGGFGLQVYDGGEGNDILSGGPRADSLTGGEGGDKVSGYDGADTIDGGAGPDKLTGIRGSDVLRGRAGRDTLSGDDGNDRLDGGDDNDRLDGGNGNDRLLGGAGSDSLVSASRPLNTEQGRDFVDCGAGRDTALVDRDDRVRRCERVRYQDD